jgi:hypothetical protein
MIDFTIQLLCTITLLSGIWLTGDKRLRGPFICFIAEIFTTTVGIMHHTWSIILIGVTLAVVQGRNFYKWRAERTPW